MRGQALADWLTSLPSGERDGAFETLLGIEQRESDAPNSAPPGEHLIGYHPSGIEPLLELLGELRPGPGDTLIDLGAGLGKPIILASLLCGVRARGIELSAKLVERARAAAERVNADVSFACDDVRRAPLDDGTIFYLYAPFTGPVLHEVLERLRLVAQQHPIVVSTLGIDLGQAAPWLRPRPFAHFWLSVYDSAQSEDSAHAPT